MSQVFRTHAAISEDSFTDFIGIPAFVPGRIVVGNGKIVDSWGQSTERMGSFHADINRTGIVSGRCAEVYLETGQSCRWLPETSTGASHERVNAVAALP